MSNILWKNFHLCFSKFKCFPTTTLSPPQKQDHSHTSNTSTTSIMINNFNSLYDLTSDSTPKSPTTPSTDDDYFSSTEDSDSETTPPDFATLFASQRFFFSSPGSSNSIFQSPDPPPESDTLLNGGVAIPKYSPDPYIDFRLSMQEMVEARELVDGKDNWEYLHELLLCYLTLNPTHTHKFIISAFADLVICLMSSSANVDCRREPEERRRSAVSRLLL